MPSNIRRFNQRVERLPIDQLNTVTHHMLGGVSDFVPAKEWDAAVDRAMAFVATMYPDTDGRGAE